MVANAFNKATVYEWLSHIPDPEIPVVSIQEMGMLRDVNIVGNSCEVIITPTYTGCPAMGMIEADIKSTLRDKGISDVQVKLVYSPAWTTDWMTNETKLKLKNYGIAPPVHSTCSKVLEKTHVLCPLCSSSETKLISLFGSTACKSLYRCETCKEPFEYFKCH